MALGEKSNVEQCLDALLARLQLITKSNGYWNDVKQVVLPNWTPLSDQMMALDAPSLQVWATDIELDREHSAFGEARVGMSAYIVGTIKNDREVQRQLIRLHQDLFGSLYWDHSRDHPNVTAANTWGFTTEDAGTTFMVDEGDQSKGQGFFISKWKVVARVPRPNG